MNVSATPVPESRPHYERWERLRSEATWTPAVRAFAKKADLCVVHFDTVPDAPSWHRDAAFVELKFVKENRTGQEETMHVKFAGYIGTGHRDDLREVTGEYSWQEYSREPENLYRPTAGSWLLYLYPNQSTHAHSCLMAIPSKSKLVFRARLDHATSPVLAESRLHADVLVMETSKNDKRQEFSLDTQVSKHNSARFGFSH